MTISFFSAALASWRATHASLAEAAGTVDPGDAVVKLSVKTTPDARTAETLGTEREGTGVVIDPDGLIVTIGYLILEAGSILVVAPDGRVFPATVVGYDHASGFGVLRTARGVARKPLALGDSSNVKELSTVTVAAHAAAGGVSRACVVSRRRFTGWWEYMIDDAIFTSPPRYDHSGAALIDDSGRLVGIASLWVGDAVDLGVAFPGNMFVPIDLAKPLIADLAAGRRPHATRPWLGVYTEEVDGHVVVTRVLDGAPADKAGLRRGDVILGVAGQSIGGQGEFYGKLWAAGAAGADITLHVVRNRAVRQLQVQSVDRMDFLLPWRI